MEALLTRLVLRLETWSLMWMEKQCMGCFTLRWWNYCWRWKTPTLFSLLVFNLIVCYNTSVSDMCLFCRVEVMLQFPQPLLKILLLKLVQLEEIVTEAKWWEEPRSRRKRKLKKGKKTISSFLSISGFTNVYLQYINAYIWINYVHLSSKIPHCH